MLKKKKTLAPFFCSRPTLVIKSVPINVLLKRTQSQITSISIICMVKGRLVTRCWSEIKAYVLKFLGVGALANIVG